jgi:cation diffusion facilitator family transporter
MVAPDPMLERRPLLRSIALTAVLGGTGIVWGLLTGSQLIVLDGAYALIGLVVSWLLLLASRLAGTEPGGRFPFGREAVTPLVIGVQGFVLIATLVYAAVEAVATILAGGTSISAGWATVYALVTTAASLVFWSWLRAEARGSDVLQAEAAAWRIGALGGIGMVVGFGVIWTLDRVGGSWSTAAAYVDPVMVIATCVLFLPSPVRMVRTTILELLEGEPGPEVAAPVRAIVAEVVGRRKLPYPDLRMTKVGPKLYVELELVVAPTVTIAEQHAVREELRGLLDELPFDLWLNVEMVPSVGPLPS